MSEIFGEIVACLFVGAVEGVMDASLRNQQEAASQRKLLAAESTRNASACAAIGVGVCTRIPHDAIQQQFRMKQHSGNTASPTVMFGVDVTSKADGATWRVYKRYNDFFKLWLELASDRNRLGSQPLAGFPRKHFGPCEGEKLQRRREMLELWLHNEISLASQGFNSFAAKELETFLECDVHKKNMPASLTVPEVALDSPSVRGTSLQYSRPAEVSVPDPMPMGAPVRDQSCGSSSQTMEIQIPHGVEAGQCIAVNLPNGVQRKLTVPQGAVSGSYVLLHFDEMSGDLLMLD